MKKTKIMSGIILLSLFVVPRIALAQWDEGLSSIFDFGLPEGSIIGIITGVLNWILGILGILGIIGFAISGVMYLISTGDETMAKRAKNGMLYSIIGIVVGLAGVVLIQAIDSALDEGVGF